MSVRFSRLKTNVFPNVQCLSTSVIMYYSMSSEKFHSEIFVFLFSDCIFVTLKLRTNLYCITMELSGPASEVQCKKAYLADRDYFKSLITIEFYYKHRLQLDMFQRNIFSAIFLVGKLELEAELRRVRNCCETPQNDESDHDYTEGPVGTDNLNEQTCPTHEELLLDSTIRTPHTPRSSPGSSSATRLRSHQVIALSSDPKVNL